MANNYLKELQGLKETPYRVELIGLDKKPVSYQGLFQVTPEKSFDQIAKTNLIIVTAINGDLEEGIIKNKSFISWINSQRIKNNAEIASLSKSAFLLVESELITSNTPSTHWTLQNDFK